MDWVRLNSVPRIDVVSATVANAVLALAIVIEVIAVAEIKAPS